MFTQQCCCVLFNRHGHEEQTRGRAGPHIDLYIGFGAEAAL